MKVKIGGEWKNWTEFESFLPKPFTDASGLFGVLSTTGFPSVLYGPWVGLEVAPELDTSSVTSTNSMFAYCKNLVSVPHYDTSNVTDFTGMYRGCSSLTYVPSLNMSKAERTTALFNGCSSLLEIPQGVDTSKSTNVASMFHSCRSITSLPALNFSSTTGSNTNIFANCELLTTIPLINLGSANNLSSMFKGCFSLVELPALDLGNVTASNGLLNFVNECTSLTTAPLKNVGVNLSVEGTKLNATALNELFQGLSTVTNKTITITDTPGAATANRSIATNKGWTVTG